MGWEYEALFGVDAPTDPDSLLYRLFPTEARVGSMQYRVKTIRSGKMMELEIYPIIARGQVSEARAAKQKLTPEQMEKANQRAAQKRITRMANENFSSADISLTLTYAGSPPAYEQCQKDIRNFLRRVRRLREKRGLDPKGLKYIYVIEDNEDGEKRRIHSHMLLTGGIPRDELEKLWAHGYANADRLQPDEHGLARLSHYITKSQRNRRKWTCSKNLKQPRVRVSDSKLSNRRVHKLASQLPGVAKEVLEKVFPGFAYVESSVRTSDWISGVYIEALMQDMRRPLTPRPPSPGSGGRGRKRESAGTNFSAEKFFPDPFKETPLRSAAKKKRAAKGVQGGDRKAPLRSGHE